MKRTVMLFILILCLSITPSIAAAASLQGVQLKDMNNKTVSLDKYKGRKTYIKMWASWCPICLSGLKELDTLSADTKRNFNIITIVTPNYKGEKNTQKFIQWYKGLEYRNITVLLDEKGEILKRGQVRGYPASIILDGNLNILKTLPGHLNTEQIKGAVK